MIHPRAVVRAQLWWSAKVLPVLGAAAFSALLVEAEPGSGLTRLLAMVLSAAGLGAMAHLVNDGADLEADQLAGKPNALVGLPTAARYALVALALTGGLAPWLVIRPSAAVLALIASVAAVPFLYSARPVRLKGRSLGGALADAANAHVLPTALAMALMADGYVHDARWWIGFGAAIVWSSGFGLRSIVVHQLGDEAGDRIAGVRTLVVHRGPDSASSLGKAAFWVELAGLSILWAVSTAVAPGVGLAFGVYLALWLLERPGDDRPYTPVPHDRDGWMPLAEFYEVWPVLLYATALCLRDRPWWPLPVATVALFAPVVAKQTADLAGLATNGAKVLWWKVCDIPWGIRVIWHDTRFGRLRYTVPWALKRWAIGSWLFACRQGRRFRRIVLRRGPTA